MVDRVYSGSFVHALAMDKLEVVKQGAIGVSSEGKIVFVARSESEAKSEMDRHKVAADKIVDLGKRFLVPGLVDTHVHAPQYTFTGTGYGIPLLEWLNKYTFKYESRFKELDFAKQIYPKAVRRLLKNGTTTAVWFATIHLEATKYLGDLTLQLGQRAFVGKVNMDMNSPDFYIETSEQSYADTEAFVKYALSKKSDLITPIITPRFAPTCTPALMLRLGALVKEFDLPVQSHISENVDEIKWVQALFPDQKSYAEVYKAHNLLTNKTIMAHGVWLTEAEIDMFVASGAGVAHCPLSNICLTSGYMPLRHLVQRGVKIGLGTDVSGGYSPSMLNAMREAISVSTTVFVEKDRSAKPLNHAEAFYLATQGGAELIGLGGKIGNFLVGKDFDALIVNGAAKGSPFDVFPFDELENVFEKFCFLGDDRNVEEVFVKGRKLDLSE